MDISSFSLLSISDDLEAGFDGVPSSFNYHRSTNKRAGLYCSGAALQDGEHFLDSCSFCRRQIEGNRDVYMYKGNSPFCSKACRQEQMEVDDAGEKRRKVGSRVKKGRLLVKNEITDKAGGTLVVG